jgi:hypothetical protein
VMMSGEGVLRVNELKKKGARSTRERSAGKHTIVCIYLTGLRGKTIFI